MPCNMCIPCRVKKREQWASRILLEASGHPLSWFVTLTYEEAPLVLGPDALPAPTLVKRHTQLFMKRLRKWFSPEPIRYFCVGEYGSRTGRPHYHYALFGPNAAPWEGVDASWGRGFTTCDALTPERARYVARYTTKKMTSPTSYTDGRCPEFATMSRRPGLGARAVSKIGRQLAESTGSGWTVPGQWNIGGKSYPLDAYTRSIIAELVGEPFREEKTAYLSHATAADRRDAAELAGGAEAARRLEEDQKAKAQTTDRL